MLRVTCLNNFSFLDHFTVQVILTMSCPSNYYRSGYMNSAEPPKQYL